ncbi:MAG TPA: DUF4402 domain-containing protein [Sphingomicrobium sp.]
MRLKITLAALAASVAFASPATAQTSAVEPAIARGTVLQRLTLTEDADLDFGTVLATATAGDVGISADTGVRSVSGGVSAVAINAGHRAQFTGYGTPGTQVNLSLSYPAFLTSGANVVAVDPTVGLYLDSGGATRTINAAGTFQVGVGGLFNIAANQPNGVYTGTFTVTAQYP